MVLVSITTTLQTDGQTRQCEIKPCRNHEVPCDLSHANNEDILCTIRVYSADQKGAKHRVQITRHKTVYCLFTIYYVDHQAAPTQLNTPPVLYLFRRKLSILSVFRFIIMAWQQAQCADAVPVLCLSVCLSVQCRYCLNKCTNLHTF